MIRSVAIKYVTSKYNTFQELATPKADIPDHGYIVPNVELSPLCSPKFRPGPPSEQAQVLSKLIDIVLNNSRALDLKDLCICKNKLVWVLYCDILCLNYNGSVIDACIGAMIAALKTCKLYIISILNFFSSLLYLRKKIYSDSTRNKLQQ